MSDHKINFTESIRMIAYRIVLLVFCMKLLPQTTVLGECIFRSTIHKTCLTTIIDTIKHHPSQYCGYFLGQPAVSSLYILHAPIKLPWESLHGGESIKFISSAL